MIKRILSYMRPYRKYAVLAVLCIAVEAMFELIIPLFMSNLVDIGVATGNKEYIFSQGLLMCVCAIIALFLGSVCIFDIYKYMKIKNDLSIKQAREELMKQKKAARREALQRRRAEEEKKRQQEEKKQQEAQTEEQQ